MCSEYIFLINLSKSFSENYIQSSVCDIYRLNSPYIYYMYIFCLFVCLSYVYLLSVSFQSFFIYDSYQTI